MSSALDLASPTQLVEVIESLVKLNVEQSAVN